MNRGTVASVIVLLAFVGCRAPLDSETDGLPPRGHPLLTAQLGWSNGILDHEIKGTSDKGGNDASTFRGRLETRLADASFGFGIEGLATTSRHSDLGTLLTSEERVVDVFAYSYFLLGDGDELTMPLRAGMFYQRIDLNDPPGALFSAPADDGHWSTFGGRLHIEPEVRLLYSGGFSWSVYAGGFAGIGATEAEVEDVDGYFGSWSYHTGYELGMRWEIEHFLVDASYMSRRIDVDEGQNEYGMEIIPGIVSEFSGVMISGGVRF